MVLISAVVVAGCGEAAQRPSSDSTLRVVATTMHVADLARNVGGDRVQVAALLPPNADPHAHEVRPSDVEAIAEADVVLRSGGEVDAWLQEVIDSAGTDLRTVNLIEKVQTIEGSHGDDHAGEEAGHDEDHEPTEAEAEVDPHWWQDPRNAERAVAAIADAFGEADPGGAQAYRADADAYARRVRELDRRVAACMGAIPAEQRKLVTTHDALGYFAARYDIEVIGTVIPSLSTQGQPSAGETAELVETVRRENAKAVFTEATVNTKVEQAIAEQAGAELGEPLLTDTLAPEGKAGDSYLDAMALNAERLAAGFTGERERCDLGV